jgi:hypothetical protein
LGPAVTVCERRVVLVGVGSSFLVGTPVLIGVRGYGVVAVPLLVRVDRSR